MSDGTISATPLTMAELHDELESNFDEAFQRGLCVLGSVTGTNTITAAATPTAIFHEYRDGQQFMFKPAADNTGAATLNINSIGAKAIVSPAGAALVAGSLTTSAVYIVVYSSSDDRFQLVGSSSDSSGGTPDEYVAFTATGSFAKADYPGARCFEVIMQGPGGPGATADYGQGRGGGGGGAGGQAIKVFNPADLADSITVTINSTKAEFAHTTAVVGNAGSAGSTVSGGAGGSATGGDLNFTGESGENAQDDSNNSSANGGRGGSPLGLYTLGAGGHRGSALMASGDTGQLTGAAGQGYGAGGGGGAGNDFYTANGSGGSGAAGYGLVKVKY
jgi:hypothetical protein